MDDLENFYRSSLKTLTIILAVLAIIIAKNITPWIETDVIPLVSRSFPSGIAESLIRNGLNFLLSGSFFTLLFLVGERFIRRQYWKFVHRDLDFSGEWLGITYYTDFEGETATVTRTNFDPFISKHGIFIEQDCTKIAITPAKGEVFVNWGSYAVSLSNDCTLAYAYWVNYDDVRFPDNAIGYEEMKVLRPDPNIKHTPPIVMSGFFYHCAQRDKKPIYRGKTVFVRAKYLHLVDKRDLPEFAYPLLEENHHEQ